MEGKRDTIGKKGGESESGDDGNRKLEIGNGNLAEEGKSGDRHAVIKAVIGARWIGGQSWKLPENWQIANMMLIYLNSLFRKVEKTPGIPAMDLSFENRWNNRNFEGYL